MILYLSSSVWLFQVVSVNYLFLTKYMLKNGSGKLDGTYDFFLLQIEIKLNDNEAVCLHNKNV